ncbi:MAG: LysE family translocator [Hyphomicrobiales bacterium]|nr:LysE family translocator [Hyphomicrobiales bacterium]
MISWEEITALLVFAFASTWTPGPNNILLTNSGARFGFRRTIPHALGVALGFPMMIFLVALGLGELFQTQPWFQQVLRIVGAAVLGWICWRIATLPVPKEDGTGQFQVGKPWRFLQAVAFQWINPKAWGLAIAVISAHARGDGLIYEALLCSVPFVISGLTSAHGWTLFGTFIRGFLNTPLRFRVYNLIMGALVGISGVFLFFGV